LVIARVLGRGLSVLLEVIAAFQPSASRAGPPFVTDDPVPADYRNWEIYTGFQYQNEGGGVVVASVPFAEFNYGAMPNVQVSLSLPMERDDSGNAHSYGYGMTEFGIKTRFVQESDRWPQISFYPSVQIPSTRGERVETFLPLWLQKSSGPWTAFGGGGVSLTSESGERDSTFVGGALQRSLSRATTLGVEIYHQGADTIGGTDVTAANVGMTAQIGDDHAILFSLGPTLHGKSTFSAYASYEFMLGPAESK
jgi:hypothetical protein